MASMEVKSRQILSRDDLTPAEKSLVNCVQTGAWWEHRRDSSFGPKVSAIESDKTARTIRSGVIYQLLSGHGELSADSNGQPVAVRAVRMMGAIIIGQLDLRHLTARCPLEIVDTEFERQTGPILLEGAKLPNLALGYSQIPGLHGVGLRILGEMNLRSVVSNESVNLEGAQVSGSLVLQGAKLGRRGQTALFAERLEVGGHLLANGGFEAFGTINLINSTIGSQFNLDGAILNNPGAFTLMAEGTRVDGSVFMRSGFETDGALSFYNARIGGGVILDGAHLSHPGKDCIDLSLATISGNLQASANFEADGTIRLMGTTVEGSIFLSGGTIRSPGGLAIMADRAHVAGSVLARSGFVAEGCINLIDANIGMELGLDGAHLKNPGSRALTGDRLAVGGAVYLRSSATVDGQIHLAHSTISGALVISQAAIINPNDCALNLEHATLKSSFVLKPKAIEGSIDLTAATATEYLDNETARLTPSRLTGFRYESIRPEPPTVSAQDRAEWLRTDPDGYGPSGYTHLAEVLRKRGHSAEAKMILVESQRRRLRNSGPRRLFYSPWSAIQRYTIGYGYRPWLAFAWLAAVIGLGSLYFHVIGSSAFAPATSAPPYNALLYTIDNALPFVDLGYSKWVARGIPHAVSSIIVVVGWLLATALVAALAGLFRRGD